MSEMNIAWSRLHLNNQMINHALDVRDIRRFKQACKARRGILATIRRLTEAVDVAELAGDYDIPPAPPTWSAPA